MKTLALLVLGVSIMCGCTSKKATPESTSVIVVGMRQSAKYGSCPGADVDANAMYNLLSKYTSNAKVYLNAQAKKSIIVNALKDAVNSELCIFYYSGHGGSNPTSDGFEVDGKDEFLCLYDAPLVDNEIWNIISQSKGRVFLIFDCCHSETMFRSPVIEMKSAQVAMASNYPLIRSSVNMLCWSGCPDNTYSYGDTSGGVFTTALLKSYDKNSDYDESWKRLCNLVDLTKFQVPRKTQIGSGFNCEIFR